MLIDFVTKIGKLRELDDESDSEKFSNQGEEEEVGLEWKKEMPSSGVPVTC